VSYLNSAVPYRILNLVGKNCAVPLFSMIYLYTIGLYSVYTSEYSSIFRIETPKNYFIHSPRVRIIPFNSELIQCMSGMNESFSFSKIFFLFSSSTKRRSIISFFGFN